MPTQQLTIPKIPDSETALNRQQLETLGLQHIVRLSGQVWTDYNVHDPGITTLELLCYSLTDLAFRSSRPVRELLATRSGNAESMEKRFPTARRILTNRPVTIADHQKLLIDIKGVKNAWLVPAKITYFADTVRRRLVPKGSSPPSAVPVQVAGVFDILLEYIESDATNAKKQAINSEVNRRLHANRNLGQDFGTIKEVPRQTVLLCGEFDLETAADVSQVKAEILFQVQQFLAPSVPNHSLDEMFQRKHPDGTPYATDDIFNGPVLEHGFIDDTDIENAVLRTEIRLSDIINIIMDIPGVRAVRDLVINRQGTAQALDNKWVISIDADHLAQIDNDASRLIFYKRNVPVLATQTKFDEHFLSLEKSTRSKLEVPTKFDLDVPLGRYSQVEQYHSFQNHFPATYGIGEAGNPVPADTRRRELAYQFKGYLLFFDQVMANFLAQLSHLGDLFSTDPEQLQSYFYQKVDFAAHEMIYNVNDPVSEFEDRENPVEVLKRRHRFLDHLTARYAERLTDIASFMLTTFGFSPECMVSWKCDFLNRYDRIGSERGLAYNHVLNGDADLWNSENVSGLEKRLAALLGLRNFSRRDLSVDVEAGHVDVVQVAPGQFAFSIKRTDDGTTVIESPTGTTFPQPIAEQIANATLHAANMASNYKRVTLEDGKQAFEFRDNGNVVAVSKQSFDTEAELIAKIEEFAEYFRLNSTSEGMFLIESILLRPEQPDDPFLPLSSDPQATSPADLDPYSDRIHIFLPAYGSRFAHMEFRRFVESVIREETPAHLLPKVCWISVEDMTILESRYRDWIELKSGKDRTNRKQKLTDFIDALFKVKNVYPTENLHECDSGVDQAKFLLGQSALGTMEAPTNDNDNNT